jgi:hypothetical protein
LPYYCRRKQGPAFFRGAVPPWPTLTGISILYGKFGKNTYTAAKTRFSSMTSLEKNGSVCASLTSLSCLSPPYRLIGIQFPQWRTNVIFSISGPGRSGRSGRTRSQGNRVSIREDLTKSSSGVYTQCARDHYPACHHVTRRSAPYIYLPVHLAFLPPSFLSDTAPI